jgi:hypothetical protein
MTPVMPPPKPLTEKEKRILRGMGIAGAVVLCLGIYIVATTNASTWMIGALLGGGASMVTASLMQLYYRPDR